MDTAAKLALQEKSVDAIDTKASEINLSEIPAADISLNLSPDHLAKIHFYEANHK